MERRVINPWTWQDQFGFVQANEVTGAQKILVCSGQTSVSSAAILATLCLIMLLQVSIRNMCYTTYESWGTENYD